MIHKGESIPIMTSTQCRMFRYMGLTIDFSQACTSFQTKVSRTWESSTKNKQKLVAQRANILGETGTTTANGATILWQQCAQIFRRNVSETLGTFRRPKHWRGNSRNGLLALLCLEASGQVGTYIYKDPEAMRNRDIGRPLQEPVDHVSLDMFCTNHALCSGQDFRQNTSEKNPAKHQRYNLVYSNAPHISANLTNVSKFPPSASNFLCVVTNKCKSATRVLNDSKILMWSCFCVMCMCVQHTVHNGTKCSLRHERKKHCLSFSSTPRFVLSIQNMVWSVWSKSELHCCYAAMLGNVAFGGVTFVFGILVVDLLQSIQLHHFDFPREEPRSTWLE